MVHAIRLLAILCLSLAVCRADIDLTPITAMKEMDGAKIAVLTFRVDDHTATYRPPSGWSCNGSTNSLQLSCSGDKEAQVAIGKIPLAKPIVFDEPQMKLAADFALQSLPKGNTNAKIISQEKNPLVIGQKETIETVVAYQFYGHSLKRSILDLNMGKIILRFELVAEVKDFEKTHKDFRNSLFSWNGL